MAAVTVSPSPRLSRKRLTYRQKFGFQTSPNCHKESFCTLHRLLANILWCHSQISSSQHEKRIVTSCYVDKRSCPNKEGPLVAVWASLNNIKTHMDSVYKQMITWPVTSHDSQHYIIACIIPHYLDLGVEWRWKKLPESMVRNHDITLAAVTMNDVTNTHTDVKSQWTRKNRMGSLQFCINHNHLICTCLQRFCVDKYTIFPWPFSAFCEKFYLEWNDNWNIFSDENHDFLFQDTG